VRRRNLLLVAHPDANHLPTFREVARHVREICSDVVPIVADHRRRRLGRWRWASRPTLVFSPVELQRFRPARGAVYHGRHLPKSAELEAMERAGIPVPRWTLLGPDREPDLGSFGPYVVTKPDLGKRGAEVRIVKRSRVRWKPEHGATRVAQEFIYTGRWPLSYRVTTLFGEVLWSMRAEADRSRRPLEHRDAWTGDARGGGMSIVSTGKGSVFALTEDPEVLELGRRIHEAFPAIPLLGSDIVREVPSGKLYALEANASGWTWHFSSPTGLTLQQTFGLDFDAQFGGLRRAAETLVERTRRLAR
jgi:hypothetical protein